MSAEAIVNAAASSGRCLGLRADSRKPIANDLARVKLSMSAILVQVEADLFAEAGRWSAQPDAIGTPDVVYPNILGSATTFSKHAKLLMALHGTCGADGRLGDLWRERLFQPFVDATTAAIVRDQAAGAVSENLDPAGTSLILTLLAEGASLELLGRRGIGPEEYADVIAPIWMSALFGVLPESARF